MRVGHNQDGVLFFEIEGQRVLVSDLELGRSPRTVDQLVRMERDEQREFLERLEDGLSRKEEPVLYDPQQPVGAALMSPSKIIAVGLNFHQHCEEVGVGAPVRPSFTAKFPSSLTGHGSEVSWRTEQSKAVDYEGELAMVIGTHIGPWSRSIGTDTIFGYTVANDLTARDEQFSESQWVRSKSFDGFCPLGPTIVTPDELGDPSELNLTVRVNGHQKQSAPLSDMVFSPLELIRYIAKYLSLEPGDLVLTGTPAGVGHFKLPPSYLDDGDEVAVQIDRIGTLSVVCRVRSDESTVNRKLER